MICNISSALFFQRKDTVKKICSQHANFENLQRILVNATESKSR